MDRAGRPEQVQLVLRLLRTFVAASRLPFSLRNGFKKTARTRSINGRAIDAAGSGG
jgi:hypothetical protein